MDLEELRSEIRKTDKDILELLKRRLELAKKVGEYKVIHDEEVRNIEVEERVAKAYRDFASENGMNPDYADTICRILMKESVEKQEELFHSK